MQHMNRPAHSDRGIQTTETTSQSQLHIERREIIEQERRRIARDLHDGAVQQIIVALHSLEITQRFIEMARYEQAQHELRKGMDVLQQSLQELRSSVYALLPPALHQRPFVSAFTELLDEFAANRSDIVLKSTLPALQHVPTYLEITLYRLLQEALANIQKHAHATQIEVSLTRRDATLTLRIHDNGQGFSIQQYHRQNGHMGIQTMRSRVEEQGGRWQIQSQPGHGTTIRAHFPLPTA